MTNPIKSQMISRHQFSAGNENINSRHVSMPRIGVSGTNGARKGRFAFGLVLHIPSTAAQPITNANGVRMLVISAKRVSGKTPAIDATKTPVRIVDFQGVRNFGWIDPKKAFGT